MLYRAPRILFVALLLVASTVYAEAPKAGAPTPRIMMVGDSWAFFMYVNRSLKHALERAGLGQYEEIGLYTAVPGSTSKQWNNPKWLQNITDEYNRNPTVDIIHISLGGNGFLRQWNKEMPDAERDALFQSITDEIEVVVRHCLALSPNMKVAICGYDYVNEPRRNSTIADLNRAGMILSGMKRDMANRIDRAEYIQSYGVSQYHFGHAPEFGPQAVPMPGQWPDFKPWPGGNDNYGNAPEAMLDDIHLSPKGYEHLADHCVATWYKKWLTEADAAAPAQAAAAAATN